jgi:hypothetical protein
MSSFLVICVLPVKKLSFPFYYGTEVSLKLVSLSLPQNCLFSISSTGSLKVFISISLVHSFDMISNQSDRMVHGGLVLDSFLFEPQFLESIQSKMVSLFPLRASLSFSSLSFPKLHHSDLISAWTPDQSLVLFQRNSSQFTEEAVIPQAVLGLTDMFSGVLFGTAKREKTVSEVISSSSTGEFLVSVTRDGTVRLFSLSLKKMLVTSEVPLTGLVSSEQKLLGNSFGRFLSLMFFSLKVSFQIVEFV